MDASFGELAVTPRSPRTRARPAPSPSPPADPHLPTHPPHELWTGVGRLPSEGPKRSCTAPLPRPCKTASTSVDAACAPQSSWGAPQARSTQSCTAARGQTERTSARRRRRRAAVRVGTCGCLSGSRDRPTGGAQTPCVRQEQSQKEAWVDVWVAGANALSQVL
eukprot:140443-Chlamydomonas_euryale.AAC.1